MFLTKLYNDLAEDRPVYLYKTPIMDESEFFKTLAQDIFGIKYSGELNFTHFMKIVEASNNNSVATVLLDEAQLYDQPLMEKIRLLSDSRTVKFVITLHKTNKEDLIAKEHFQTRIWESIELVNLSADELHIYIQKKLIKEECFNAASMFHPKAIKKIHALTQGNYRDTNKLLYTLFEIYATYERNNQIFQLKTDRIAIKFIEMAAIHTGLIDA